METASRKQDMPPPGGFRPLNFERVPARTYLSTPQMVLGFFAITAGSVYLYSVNYLKIKKLKIEMRSSLNAILPLLLAERDRAFLKQLRINRDLEADLMKNVEGWVVGTYYGEPIYKTIPEDTVLRPSMREYYIHSSAKDTNHRANLRFWE